MRHVCRACVAVAIAVVIAVAGLTPAEASRGEVADPAGDVAVAGGCDRGTPALDIRQVVATAYAAAGTWHLRATMTVADLPRPVRGREQSFTWVVSDGGRDQVAVTVTRRTVQGRVRLEAAVPQPSGVIVRTRGNAVVVRGVDLPTGRDLRVSGRTDVASGDASRCAASDTTRSTPPLATYS